MIIHIHVFSKTFRSAFMCLFSAPSPPGVAPTGIIAGAAAGVVVILITLIIGILLCRRHAKKKGNIEEISSGKLSQ